MFLVKQMYCLVFTSLTLQPCDGVSVDHRVTLDQNIKMDKLTEPLVEPLEPTNAPDKSNDCLQSHEYAEVIHESTAERLMTNVGRGTTLVVHNFVSRDGTKQYYICRRCRVCGTGVKVVIPCQFRNDTVCGKTCIDPRKSYNSVTQTCGFSSRNAASGQSPWTKEIDTELSLVSAPSSIPADISTKTTPKIAVTSTIPPTPPIVLSGVLSTNKDTQSTTNSLHDCENTQQPVKQWRPILLTTITLGVISLNVMLIIVLRQCICKRKKTPEEPGVDSGPNIGQNNVHHNPRSQQRLESEPEESPEDRIPLATSDTTYSTFNNPIPAFGQCTSGPKIVTVTTATLAGSPDIGPNCIKDNNLNQHVSTLTGTPSYFGSIMNIPESRIVNTQIQVKPGTEPYWIEMSGYFGPQGGTLSCDESDVIVEIPPGAIPATNPRQLITAKVSRTPGIFSINLDEGGLFLSPLVDCQSPGLKRFKKDVTIKLPHRAHLRPEWKFLVHYTDDESLTRGSGWNTVGSSAHNLRRDLQKHAAISSKQSTQLLDVQFTVDTKYVYITTPHFSQYTCSGCGKERELSFEAVVYINGMDLDGGRRVDLHCYLLDSIKDFRRKVNENESYKQRTPHKPLIIDAKKGKEVELSLMDMGEDWSWEIDERVHKATQVVNVDELIRCHSDVVPDYTTFTLRPRRQHDIPNNDQHRKTTSCLETHLNIKQKSRAKGITIDIAVDLDGGSFSNSQGASKEVGLMKVFSALSNRLTANQWKPLFRALMTSVGGCAVNVEAKISFIENKDPRDLKEQIYSGFLEWYHMNGKHATLEKLRDCLKKEQLESLVEEASDIYHHACVKDAVSSKSQVRSSESFETTV